MDIVLTQGGSRVLFPVLPSAYQISSGQNNTTVNVNAVGEVNLLGWPNLDSISWSSIFPRRAAPYSVTDIMTPFDYVQALTRMKAEGPMDLHLLDVLAIHVTIESLTWGEKDGTGDIEYSIDLKRYIYINSEGVVTKTILSGGQGRAMPDAPRGGKTYIVKAGDNLLSIARRELGISDWSGIYALNESVIGPDPTVLKPGLRLTMPINAR